MKTFLLYLLVLLFCSAKTFAGGGHAARYHVDLTDINDNVLTGYIYINSFEDDFDKETGNFFDYVLRHTHSKIKIYKKIKSVVIRPDFRVDFTVKDEIIEIDKEKIRNLNLKEKENFLPGMKVILLNMNEYNIIEGSPIQTSFFYNEKFSENCSYLILSWSDTENLESIKEDMEVKCLSLIEENKLNDFYKYIDTIKLSLIHRKIIIFMHCSAM